MKNPDSRAASVLQLITTVVLCTFIACDKSPTEPQLSRSEKLQSALDTALLRCPERRGVSVAIAGPGEDLWLGVSGMSDPEAAELITEDMLFNMGWSVPDMYAAALILLYEEEGLIGLDDPISGWLGDFQHIEEDSITVEHLLRHSSGLFDYLTNQYCPILHFNTMNHHEVWSPDGLLERYLDTPYSTPGSDWRQSATDYLIVRMIIDAISDSNRVQAFRDRIFSPLGLGSTFIEYFEDIPSEYPVAHGWFWNLNGDDLIDISSRPRTAVATGVPMSMLCTAGDLALFMKDLLEGNLLGQASMDKLLDFQSTGLTEPAEYGLGINRSDYEGYEYVHHGGWDYGYESLVAYFPGPRFSISILCNYHGSTTSRIFPALMEVMLEEVH